jgi:DNA-binding GntR family transcriptional regulator
VADESCGRLNYQFHCTLYSRANRPRFMPIIQALNKNGRLYMCLHLFPTRAFEQARPAHHEILNVSATRGGRRLRPY